MHRAEIRASDYIDLKRYNSEFAALVPTDLDYASDPDATLQHSPRNPAEISASVPEGGTPNRFTVESTIPLSTLTTRDVVKHFVADVPPSTETTAFVSGNDPGRTVAPYIHASERVTPYTSLHDTQPLCGAESVFLDEAPNLLQCPAQPKAGEEVAYELNDDYGLSTVSEYYLPRQPSPYMPSGVRKPSPANTICDGPRISEDDLIIDVSVYHRSTGKKHLSAQVFHRQSLCVLRDMIICAGDKPRPGNLIGNSALLYIEGRFYNDMRSVQAVDYSAPVQQWMREKIIDSTNIRRYQGGSPSSFRMEDQTFADLTVRLGEKYLFLHQGQCEHVLKFDRVRAAGSLRADSDGSIESDGDFLRFEANYPVTTYTLKPRAQKCGICTLYAAKYVVYDSAVLSETPAILCEICFDSLHRDASGRTIPEVGPKFQMEIFP